MSEPITPIERATWIAENALRLKRLVALKAPDIIIESARQSLFKRLMNFPAPAAFVEACENVQNEIQRAEQDFLMEHGYYKDVIGDDKSGSAA